MSKLAGLLFANEQVPLPWRASHRQWTCHEIVPLHSTDATPISRSATPARRSASQKPTTPHNKLSGIFCSAAVLARRKTSVTKVDTITMNSE